MRLGAWGAKLSLAEQESFIEQCIELGLVDFDLADIYGSYTTESEIGSILKRRPDLKSKIRITSKCGIKLIAENRPNHTIKSYDSTPQHIINSVEQTLSDLGVEQIELLLLHRPDYLMDAEAIADTFNTLHKSGKVKYFGASNFSTSQFELLHAFYPLVTNQIELSLMHLDPFDDGVLDQAQRLATTITCWSPFGGGALFSDDDHQRILNIRSKCAVIGEKYNASLDQILLAWINKYPHKITPIIGTTKIERVRSAIDAQKIKITHEEWYDLFQTSTGVEIP